MIKVYWTIAYWMLCICWVFGAVLGMSHFHGGFLTNYLTDLTFPPWFYIFIRGKTINREVIPLLLLVGTWFGRSPERALISIFLIGVLTKLKTFYWPHGPITGTYDLMDILCYGIGLIVCYSFDKLTNRKPEKQGSNPER